MEDCADGRADGGEDGEKQDERAANHQADRPKPFDDLPRCAHAIVLVATTLLRLP
jgi:hypothetical protein